MCMLGSKQNCMQKYCYAVNRLYYGSDRFEDSAIKSLSPMKFTVRSDAAHALP